jgi:hypothetical protein
MPHRDKTERLIRDVELLRVLPITQLRMFVDELAKKLIPHLRAQDQAIAALKSPAPPTTP